MPNFSELFTGGETTLASILWPMAFGVILAACVIFFNKQTLGKLVQRLLEDKIDSERNAKSLRELGIKETVFLRMALKPGSTFRKIVKLAPPREKDPEAEDDAFDSDTPASPEENRYYIPEENAYRAEVTYTPDGSSVLTLVIIAIMFIALTVILLAVIPKIVAWISG
ncbi:MAG: hypothetical protein E7618_08225 [Ruminococcaceae bacterium]|nr:hypothetical protein [Oscillospiraceae bacterium]